jgi:hypothetical protein|tara:strand:+ start:1116 stop:1355 length:240 start_codon:yes stop_codon:yes gene_type:complete
MRHFGELHSFLATPLWLHLLARSVLWLQPELCLTAENVRIRLIFRHTPAIFAYFFTIPSAFAETSRPDRAFALIAARGF